ncbi:MAG: alpha/beta hydrolase [Pseudomonadales bacterium]|jgi:pimeloyl-ACP methyl ester carboxylesterase|nr:alpha/beta hydrolase [Pseudomonadales bacterium]MBL6805540.1 alpha/beta hydrolase [Pseudomonadales bacterium]
MKAKLVRILFISAVSFLSFFSWAEESDFVFHSDLAEAWFEGGDYFEWTSTTKNNQQAKVDVFYRTFGSKDKPQLLMVHGFPNSSFDFYKLVPLLENDFHIAVLDFPGSGFSDKPVPNFSYMLEENAEILDYFVKNIIKFNNFAIYTHDRGVSIGLAFLGHYLDTKPAEYRINYHFLSNSGMFLPLANLMPMQTALLDPVRGNALIQARKSVPRMTKGDPEAIAYADIFKFKDGDSALIHVARYLLERAENELRWLNNLSRSDIPVAYLWGLLDDINPVRISNHVWNTYLNDRDAESTYWLLPTAGHYPQREKPNEVAKIIHLALSGGIPSKAEESTFMRAYGSQRKEEEAIFVGHSIIETLSFPSAVRYSPDGYITQ